MQNKKKIFIFKVQVGIIDPLFYYHKLLKMNIKRIIAQIKQVITPLLDSRCVELVDLELKGAVGNQVLCIYVDIEGGIDLNLCVELSRKISDLLDIEDIMPGKYRLEVSSPGTHRPLKTRNDFFRNKGRLVAVNLLDGNTIEGRIKKVSNSDIYIESEKNQFKCSLSSIKLAKLILEW